VKKIYLFKTVAPGGNNFKERGGYFVRVMGFGGVKLAAPEEEGRAGTAKCMTQDEARHGQDVP
jgi:hypothetical protein